jgi:hypothetical protein
VLADSGFAIVQDLLKRRLSLSDYLKREPGRVVHLREPPSESERAAKIVGMPVLTSVTGARFVASVFGLPGVSRNRLSVRSARDIGPLDFKGNHVILVGSVRSNPRAEMFEPKLNFRHEFDYARSQAVIRNACPGPGELPEYRVGGTDGKSSDIYSSVALLPNLSHSGSVLIRVGHGDGRHRIRLRDAL